MRTHKEIFVRADVIGRDLLMEIFNGNPKSVELAYLYGKICEIKFITSHGLIPIGFNKTAKRIWEILKTRDASELWLILEAIDSKNRHKKREKAANPSSWTA
ncbi:hypothetical protein HS7_01070 [Sulfolobales archaeon HS-7]|nr:hypothetical protein HS7_01070 [Sulfolobales archaeon HS-7]